MEKIIQTKITYLSPEVDVVNVETEGPVAGSATPVVTNPDWDTSDDTRSAYDGDIWFPL